MPNKAPFQDHSKDGLGKRQVYTEKQSDLPNDYFAINLIFQPIYPVHLLVGNKYHINEFFCLFFPLSLREKPRQAPDGMGNIRSTGYMVWHLFIVSGVTMEINGQAKIYHPRNQQEALIWQLLNVYFAEFESCYDRRFACVRCPDCNHEYLLAFSCPSRNK